MEARARAACAILALALMAGASLGVPAAAAAPVPTAAASATQTPVRYFEVGPTVELVNTAQTQSLPELVTLPSGDFALGYLDGFYSYYGNPTFSIHNATTGARVAGNFDFNSATQWDTWANTTSRGAYTAVDGNGRVARVSWGFTFPNSVVSLKVLTQTGAVAIADTVVGSTPYQSSAAAIAIGSNNTIHVVHYDAQVRYSVLRANGTWSVHNVSIDASALGQFPPQIVYNAPAGQMVVAWASRLQGASVMSVRPNGSVAWTYPFSLDGANMTVAALPSGDIAVAYATSDGLHAFTLDRDGGVVAADTVLDVRAGRARAPRAVALGGDEVALVFSDFAGGADLDVVALAYNASSLALTIPLTQVSTDAASNTVPSAARMPDGALWVGWQNETTVYYANLSGIRLMPRWTGFAMNGPSDRVVAPRGEPIDLAATLTSLVGEVTEYQFAYSFAPYGGPTNWSGEVLDGAGANPLPSTSLGAMGSTQLVLRVGAPVVDPPGYGAIVSLLATDRHRGGAPLALRVNVSIAAGHRFAVTPSDQNATGLPGATVDVPFDVRIAGTLAESAVPVAVSAAPPSGWVVSFSPGNISGAAGASVPVALRVSIPASAPSGQTYCARLRVQHPNDPFSLSTAGFCVRVALVANPTMSPLNASIEVDPGAGAVSIWTLTNVGNAADPIVCAITFVEALPTGWQSVIDPDSTPLGAGAGAAVVVSVSAPALALGGTTVNLTLRSSCEGSSAEGTAHLAVTVREVHAIQWRAAGTDGNADASGAGAFAVNVENQGNVAEPVTTSVTDALPGWNVTANLWVGGQVEDAVPPHASGIVQVAVQAPSGTLAGTYQVAMTFAAGGTPAQAVVFRLRLTKVYALNATFSASPDKVGPEGSVAIVGRIEHGGNVADTYTLRVDIQDVQSWGWQAWYTPDGGATSEVHGSVTLAPFDRGTLTINITGPREPIGRHVMIKVALSSPRGPSAEFTHAVDLVLPDLSVTFVGAPAGDEGQKAFDLDVRVANAGETTSPPARLSIRVDGAEVASATAPAIGSGEVALFTVNVSALIAAGPHDLRLIIDPLGDPGGSSIYGSIFERNEANNAANATFSLAAATAPPTARPPANVNTPAAQFTGILVLAAIAAGTVAFAVLRIRMRRKDEGA